MKTTPWTRRRYFSVGVSGLAACAILTGTCAYAAHPVIKVGHISPNRAADVVRRSDNLKAPSATILAIASTHLDTVVGQWQNAGGAFDLKIVGNAGQPDFALTDAHKPLA